MQIYSVKDQLKLLKYKSKTKEKVLKNNPT